MKKKILVLKVLTIIFLIQLGLRFLSFQSFKNLYARLSGSKENSTIPREIIKEKVRAIKSVSPVLGAECLPQALALKYFLRNDESVKIQIGISRNKEFEAHAWVEQNENILIGDFPGKNFEPLWNWN